MRIGQSFARSGWTSTDDAIRIKLRQNIKIGSKDGINFEMRLKIAGNFQVVYDKYKVTLKATNSSCRKVKTTAYLNYKLYFQGF